MTDQEDLERMKKLGLTHLLDRPRWHRLFRVTAPHKLPDGLIKERCLALYEGSPSDYLTAVFLNSVITHKKPVMILSRKDLEDLIEAHGPFGEPYHQVVSLSTRPRTLSPHGQGKMSLYRGFLALITADTGWAKALNTPKQGSREPLVIEIVDEEVLKLTGPVDHTVKAKALKAAGVCQGGVQTVSSSGDQLFSSSDSQGFSNSGVQVFRGEGQGKQRG